MCRSSTGYMHMKIQPCAVDKLQPSQQQFVAQASPTKPAGQATVYWILGYFSQPFTHIPHMIEYYSVHKLPIKGAEHMCLGVPVQECLL
jgi:hypothetical protein